MAESGRLEPLPLLLRAYPFQDVSPAELEPLLPSFRRHVYPHAGRVWNQGDPATDLWFVIDGQVRTVHSSAAGDEVVTGLVGAGESIGHPGLFLPAPIRMTSCIAAEPSTLLSLRRDLLLSFLERHPAALRRMLEALSLQTASQTVLFRELAFHDVRGRVAQRILELATSHGEPVDSGIRITLQLRQATLAGLVAASRENVNRALASLAEEGAIRQEDGHIVLLRADILRRASEASHGR